MSYKQGVPEPRPRRTTRAIVVPMQHAPPCFSEGTPYNPLSFSERIPKAAVYVVGFHSPMEKELFEKLLACKRPEIWCPAWGLGRTQGAPLLDALGNNRLMILEIRDTAGYLAAAEARNRFVLKRADRFWLPHVQPGGITNERKP